MAIATTTLTSPLAATDTVMVVASAASFGPGRLCDIDQEVLQVQQGYVAGSLNVPVLRGRDGSATVAHRTGASVTHGTAADWAVPAPQTVTMTPVQRTVLEASVSATSTLAPVPAGSDMRVTLNGTSAITLTVAPPTRDMDGCELTILGNGAAAHVLTFTGGLGGVGAGYTTLTVNASGPVAFKCIASGGVWVPLTATPISGTATKVIAAIA
ncbi:MAG TPA: hypothetical protein VKE96_12365 [Vicinamibacterales bacterium]|nr:hypothetical protein [Vicinamibacterales bacterium]